MFWLHTYLIDGAVCVEVSYNVELFLFHDNSLFSPHRKCSAFRSIHKSYVVQIYKTDLSSNLYQLNNNFLLERVKWPLHCWPRYWSNLAFRFMCLLAQGVDWFSLVSPNVINRADSMYVVIVCTCSQILCRYTIICLDCER